MTAVNIERDIFGKSINTAPQYSDELLALSRARDISPEWLQANCTRSNDSWVLKGDGDTIQYKPDEPNKDANGKPIKYVSPKRSKPDVMVPVAPDGIVHPLQKCADRETLYITEGWFKALKACEVGIATASVTGIWNGAVKDGNGKRVLVPTLQDMVKAGLKKCCIAFDADAVANPDVHKASVELASLLQDAGCIVTIATGQWTVEEGKGMDDFISKNGVEAMRERLERALTLDEYKASFGLEERAKGKGKIVEGLALLDKHYGKRIRLNEMLSLVEKDGKPYSTDNAYIHLAVDTGVEMDKMLVRDLMAEHAERNAYHPVREYLTSLRTGDTTKHIFEVSEVQDIDAQIAAHVDRLGTLWTGIFGVCEEITQVHLTKTIVGAVNRVFDPGCQMRTVLVLHGGQLIGKSTFVRELAGEAFYSDSYEGTSEKDDLMKLYGAWIHELAEIDSIYKKTDTAKLKAIISGRQDRIRKPYAASMAEYKRQCILIGTSNRQDFLRDSTGDTRFWVVPLHNKVNIDVLKRHRDELWALATALYDLQYMYYLTNDEQVETSRINEAFTEVDPIFDSVDEFCRPFDGLSERRPEVCVQEIWDRLYPDKEGEIADGATDRKIREALTKLGYLNMGNKKITYKGKRVRGWSYTRPVDVQAVTAGHEPVAACLPAIHPSVTALTGKNLNLSENSENVASNHSDGDKTVNSQKFGFLPVNRSEVPQTLTAYECPVGDRLRPAEDVPVIQLSHTDDPYNLSYQAKVGDWVECTQSTGALEKGKRYQVSSVMGSGNLQVAYSIKSKAGKVNDLTAYLRCDQYKPTTAAIAL